MECECLAKCPFFNDRMGTTPSMAEIYKTRFCLADNSSCARYVVFKALGRKGVPSDLYLNQLERAQSIVAEARS